jgi:hypothetical protein
MTDDGMIKCPFSLSIRVLCSKCPYQIDFIEVYSGKKPVDIEKAKRLWLDIKDNVVPDNPCLLPTYTYPLYREMYKNSKGRKFDKEDFFLEWLEEELVLSEITQKEGYEGKEMREVIKGDIIEYVKAPHSYGFKKRLSEIIRKHFSDIDSNSRRITLKLWRFKKSGILEKMEKEVSLRLQKLQPDDSQLKENWKNLEFAQRIADFIYSQPRKKVARRDLLRHFSNKRKDDLEDLHDWLKVNYGIIFKKEKKSMGYYRTMKSSRGRYLRVGI